MSKAKKLQPSKSKKEETESEQSSSSEESTVQLPKGKQHAVPSKVAPSRQRSSSSSSEGSPIPRGRKQVPSSKARKVSPSRRSSVSSSSEGSPIPRGRKQVTQAKKAAASRRRSSSSSSEKSQSPRGKKAALSRKRSSSSSLEKSRGTSKEKSGKVQKKRPIASEEKQMSAEEKNILEALKKLDPLTKVYDPVAIENIQLVKFASAGFMTLYTLYKTNIYAGKNIPARELTKIAFSKEMFVYHLSKVLRSMKIRVDSQHFKGVIKAIKKVAALTLTGEAQVTDPSEPGLEDVVKYAWGAASYANEISGSIADWLKTSMIFRYDGLLKDFVSLRKMEAVAPARKGKQGDKFFKAYETYKSVLDELYREYSDKVDALNILYGHEAEKMNIDTFFMKFALLESLIEIKDGHNLNDVLKMFAGSRNNDFLIEEVLDKEQKKQILDHVFGPLYDKYGY